VGAQTALDAGPPPPSATPPDVVQEYIRSQQVYLGSSTLYLKISFYLKLRVFEGLFAKCEISRDPQTFSSSLLIVKKF